MLHDEIVEGIDRRVAYVCRLLSEAHDLYVKLRGLPIPMKLTCPCCHCPHIDEGEYATKPHHTHACQQCGMVWRPALVNTVGVMFLPGFKSAEKNSDDERLPDELRMR